MCCEESMNEYYQRKALRELLQQLDYFRQRHEDNHDPESASSDVESALLTYFDSIGEPRVGELTRSIKRW